MNNFAVLTIAYTPNPTTLSFMIETNNPCHLTCYYTDKEPGRHRTARTQRGLTLPWGAYYCFVAWQSVEQTEPGDTLIHTFEIPAWSYCQTKWFAFRGTVADVLSPSVSCFFKYHHPGPQPRLYEHYIINDDEYHIIAMALCNAQTFTPEISHTITSVKLKLLRVGYPGTVTVSIRATSEGVPTGPDLVTGTTGGNTLTTDIHGEWREIKLPGGPPLLAPIKHGILVSAPEGYPGNYLGWRSDHTRPTYTRGNLCLSADSGETWLQDPTADEMFEEWGIPT